LAKDQGVFAGLTYKMQRENKRRPDSALTTAQPEQMLQSDFFKKFCRRMKWKVRVADSFMCKSCTLNDLLIKYNIKQLDWLVIDTESYDYQVLKSINLDKYQPKIIIYEYVHLSKEDFSQIENMLKKHEYNVDFLSKTDQIAIKNSIM